MGLTALGDLLLSAHHSAPPGAAGLALDTALWFVMMAAMMLPVVQPWISTFAKLAPGAYARRRPRLVAGQFAAGYFAVWLGYSAVAAGAQSGLHRLAALDHELRVGAAAGGVLLIVAGLFQLTPLKGACLRHCRNPLGFLLAHWDGGASGPLRLGVRHGLWCVTCCWALMALAFVLGIMNLLWMAALTAMIVAEQRAPRRWRLGSAFGVLLCGWGLALIAVG